MIPAPTTPPTTPPINVFDGGDESVDAEADVRVTDPVDVSVALSVPVPVCVGIDVTVTAGLAPALVADSVDELVGLDTAFVV